MFVCFFSKKHKEVVPKHKHRAPQSQPSAVLFSLLANEARSKQGECKALLVKGHISNP